MIKHKRKYNNVFLKNALILTLANIIVRIIATLFNVYVSKKVGASTLGTYHLISSVYLFCINIAVAGLGLTTIKLVSRDEALGKIDNISIIMKKVVKYSLVMGSIAMVLLIILADVISKNILCSMVSSKPIYILAIALPFLSLSYNISSYFTGMRKTMVSAILQILDQISKVIVIVFLFRIFLPGGIENACIALVLGDTICEIIYCIFTCILYNKNKVKLRTKNLNEIKISKEIKSTAFPIAFTTCIRSGLNALKQSSIPKSLAKCNMLYSVAIEKYGTINGMAMPIIAFMAAFIQPISSLLLPEFSKFNAKGDRDNINKNIQKVFKYILQYSIAIIGGLWYFAEDIGIVIYNDAEVGWYIKMLCPLVVFMYLDATVDSMLRGLDKQIAVMLCNILDLAVSISFIYFVVPITGIKGYITSIFLSTILNASISIWILIRETHFEFKLKEWIIIPTLKIASVILSIHYIPINDIFKFVIYILFGSLVICVRMPKLKYTNDRKI